MDEKEIERGEDLEMRHEKTKLKDGRYMIFYEFNDLNSGSLRKPAQTDEDRSEDDKNV